MSAAAILALAVAVPGQAATTGWRVAFTHHYGVATNYSGYTAVAVPGPGDARAFGSTNLAGAPAPGIPIASHPNGTKWSGSPLPSGLHSEINAASVVSTSSVWAVTETNGDIVHWDGGRWSVAEQKPGSSGLLSTGITAVNDGDVWAFGCSGVRVLGPVPAPGTRREELDAAHRQRRRPGARQRRVGQQHLGHRLDLNGPSR